MVKTKKIPCIVLSFKQSEKWISDYAREHNSPSAWIKDLIVADYKQKNNTIGTGSRSMSLFDD